MIDTMSTEPMTADRRSAGTCIPTAFGQWAAVLDKVRAASDVTIGANVPDADNDASPGIWAWSPPV